MSKFEAIVHLYKRRLITEEKAFSLSKSRNFTEEEKNKLKTQIEMINNPIVFENND